MVTLEELLAEREQRGYEKGYQREYRRVVLCMLTQFVKLEWGDAVAADFQDRLSGQTAPLPTLRDLHERHAQGRPPLPPA